MIGAGGMLGYVTYQHLKDRGYQVIGVTRTKKYSDMVSMDATDQFSIGSFLEQTDFDAVINCAALLVNASKERKSNAIQLNAWLPHFLEEFCDKHEKYLIQAGTDGVFSGKDGGYQESSLSDTDTFYGKSKLLGETSGSHALTVRSGFWGADANLSGRGLFQWFLGQGETVHGYSRAFFNGVSNLEFAKFVDLALQKKWTGIYHLCASDVTSKYEFLELEKRVFFRKTEIVADDRICIDRSLVCKRDDIAYQKKNFETMMIELKEWLVGRGEFRIGKDGK